VLLGLAVLHLVDRQCSSSLERPRESCFESVDLGRSTGVAVLDDGSIRTCSYQAKGAERDSLFVNWYDWAKDVIEREDPEAIAFEEVQGGMRGFSYIPGMAALLFVLARDNGLTCFGVHQQTLKAFARQWKPGVTWTGSKNDMRRALETHPRRRSIAIYDSQEDEVDAAWVALWAEETLVEIGVVEDESRAATTNDGSTGGGKR